MNQKMLHGQREDLMVNLPSESTGINAADIGEIRRAIKLLLPPGQLTEMRCLQSNGPPIGGFFDDQDALATNAAKAVVKGVYIVPNPINTDLLSRSPNRTKMLGHGEASKDADILCRHWLKIDCDPVRPGECSSTDSEHELAIRKASAIESHLSSQGWPEGIKIDSGNGAHLLYRIFLPTDDAGLEKACLESLSQRFSDEQVTVDTLVFNPSRIWKLPGTVARKGESTTERPHRMAVILNAPYESFREVPIVRKDQLEALARETAIKGADGAPDERSTQSLVELRKDRSTPADDSTERPETTNALERCLAYFSKMPDAVSGNAGHNATLQAACETQRFGLTKLEAWDAMNWFNDNKCQPPWSESELQHKLRSAADKVGGAGEFGQRLQSNGISYLDSQRSGDQSTIAEIEPDSPDDVTNDVTGVANIDLSRSHYGDREPSQGDTAKPDAQRNRKRTIEIDPWNREVGYVLDDISSNLIGAGKYYVRCQQLVTVECDEIKSILVSKELAGAMSQFTEFQVVSKQGSKYETMPTNYADVWLNNPSEMAKLPTIQMFTRHPVYDASYNLSKPGFNRGSGIYFTGPAVQPIHGTKYLDAMLQDFCFATPGDRANYVGSLLTAVLMPNFIGLSNSKPATLFNGNQPGLGKSILAQIISIIRDGRPAQTLSYNPNDEEFEKRLGAAVRSGASTIVIDNAKAGRGRDARIESAVLERSITDPILSFRLLGQSSVIRAENSHSFCITANSADTGRDIVTRSCVVNLLYEGDPTRRSFVVTDPEAFAIEHRVSILGEILGLVEHWKRAGSPMDYNAKSRCNKRNWARIVGGILNANGIHGFLTNAATVEAELDPVRQDFAELVERMADNYSTWTCSELVSICEEHGLLLGELGSGGKRSKATKLGILTTRFAGEAFEVQGRPVRFEREDGRSGAVFSVKFSTPSAEPCGTYAEPFEL